MIEVRDLTKRFGDTVALAGITLHVEPGKVLGLLGPNGAGKTTLVRVLTTLLRPDGGHARVGGYDVVDQASQVRSLIGLAGQYAAVDELLTGRENLELVGRLYRLGDIDPVERAQEVLDRFGLTQIADRRVGTYSGGMRRRIDLAATLVGSPAVVVLDEPTTGLDPRSRNLLWGYIEDLVADGTTILLTSQYLEEVERLADLIVVIEHGAVIAEGTAQELKQHVGGEVLELTVADAGDLETVRQMIGDLGDGTPLVDVAERRVTLPTALGTKALVAAASRVENADVELSDLALRRPTLDDVFLALTGHTTDADAATSPDGTEAPSDIVAAARPGDEPADARPDEVRPVSRPTHRLPPPVADALAITRRNLLGILRTPTLVFFAVVQPVGFVLAFPAIFGGAVETPGTYVQYMLPGALVMTVLVAGGPTAVVFALDLASGLVDRFRSLPMSPSALLTGRTLADLLRNLVSVALVVVVGLAVGFRFDGGLARGLAGLGLVVAFGYAITWVFVAISLLVKDPQAAQFIGFLPILPFLFVGDIIIPLETLPEGLQDLGTNQPVTVTVGAVRALFEGSAVGPLAWQSLAWTAGLLLVSIVVAWRRLPTAVT